MGEVITSPQNERVKDLVRLRQRSARDQTGKFVVEGHREVERAIEAGAEIETLFTCAPLSRRPLDDLVNAAKQIGTQLVELGAAAFNKGSYRDNPDGVLAVAYQFDTELTTLDLEGQPLLLVVESIEKPGNLGTMLRTADAAGVAAILVCDPTTDPFNPNVVRSSMGALFSVPLAVSSTVEVVSFLREAGIRTVATTPNSETELWDVKLSGPVAIVVGAEDTGLSETWLERASVKAKLPMAGAADSLNAATAAAICLFEAVRQRRPRQD